MSTTTSVQAIRPLILALDVGTSSVRAVLYDSHGSAIEGCEGRTQYQMTATADGGVEIDADHLVDLICATIDQCLHHSAALLPDLDEAISGVGYSNFWHALLGVNRENKAVTPLYNWSDTRSAYDAGRLAEEPGSEWLHQRTGVIPHASYYPAKILWLRRTNLQLAARIARWISIGEYLYFRIFGRMLCGVSMASGTGLFNPNLNCWDEETLSALAIGTDQLSPLAREHEGLSGMKREFSERWPALSRAKWLPAAGDGACSNIGSGCFTRDSIAINVGTSGAMRVCWPAERVQVPQGLWCYRANHRYALIGGALSNGGDVYAWNKKTLRIGESEVVDEAALEIELRKLEPDGHGLTVLPFFSGERSTGWHDSARAAIIGINLSTRPLDILLASLEAVCYRFAAIYERLQAELDGRARIIASGGAIVHSRVWTQMMADVIGVPVAASAVPEASSRGAALLALEAFAIIEGFAAIPTPLGKLFEPDASKHEIYLRGRNRQEKFYDLLIAHRC
ncbi:MAG: gluconokinase [Blastocatellia bacterium]|nr:gluconokinase [Blastocatellia bacterium]